MREKNAGIGLYHHAMRNNNVNENRLIEGISILAEGSIMVMLTSLLALFHHPNWTWFTLFIGFNCFQSSFTGFCPPAWLMKKFALKTEAELATEGK